jgi:pimeloyl-ACP methyl ester carboxylesterase
MTVSQETTRGTFANGMPYVRWGSGAKSLLFVQGGPGSAPPSPRQLRLMGRMFRPYVDAGYAVLIVSRRRHMRAGYTVGDMADDFAEVVRDELGGRVDVVYGLSYGGLIAQYLAARHPDRVGRVVLVGAACEVSDAFKDVDYRWAVARAQGDPTAAGMVFAEYVAPGRRLTWLRRLLAPLLGRGTTAEGVPPGDLIVEARAEVAFDSRSVLPGITAPVLLVVGDRDRAFPKALVDETARLIPDCTLVWRRGRGHVGTAVSRRTPRDVLAFLERPERTRQR